MNFREGENRSTMFAKDYTLRRYKKFLDFIIFIVRIARYGS